MASPPRSRPVRHDRPGGRVAPHLDGCPGSPAFVINRTLDVLAANALAEALHSPFVQADNLARMTFLDPAGNQVLHAPSTGSSAMKSARPAARGDVRPGRNRS
ncbi:hypothetical protein GCM10018987_11570 [Streptomyces cremeus]